METQTGCVFFCIYLADLPRSKVIQLVLGVKICHCQALKQTVGLSILTAGRWWRLAQAN